jgi:hypothetical protein
MKKTFLFLFVPFFAKAQYQIKILEQALSNIAICKTEFLRLDSTTFTVATCGIILKGTYFLTCYHDIFFPNCTVKNRQIVHNYKDINGKLTYDTSTVLEYFKPLPNQYDFSKHIFDEKDHSTDIYILKLTKTVNVMKYEFANGYTNQNDTIYSCGAQYDKQSNLINLKYSISNIVFNYIERVNAPNSFVVSIGNIQSGFSGAPIYNSKGQILGISLFGWDVKPAEMIEDFRKRNIFSEDSYNRIIDGYAKGLNLSAAIDINYLIEKYLTGYL